MPASAAGPWPPAGAGEGGAGGLAPIAGASGEGRDEVGGGDAGERGGALPAGGSGERGGDPHSPVSDRGGGDLGRWPTPAESAPKPEVALVALVFSAASV